MNPVFIDTNILVYLYDTTEQDKLHTAETLITNHFDRAVISSQVVQEFCNVAIKKMSMDQPVLQNILTDLCEPLCKHWPSTGFYKAAIQLQQQHSLSFYDALIVQAALDTNCSTLYSEDMQHGRQFGTLTIQNPF